MVGFAVLNKPGEAAIMALVISTAFTPGDARPEDLGVALTSLHE